MKIFRRFVFFIHLVVFLIGAPKLVFYALGYSYSLGHEKGIVKTGLVYLSTAPPGASVYVGGRLYQEATPTIIRDLLPGNYPIRMELKNYLSWTQTVPVEAGKASVLGKILLLPKKPDWKMRAQGEFGNLSAIPGTSYLLMTRAQAPGLIETYNWKEKKTSSLFTDAITPEFKTKKIHFVPEGETVLVEGEDRGHRKWVAVQLDHGNSFQEIEGDPFPAQSEEVIWDPKDEKTYFSIQNNAITKIDFHKKQEESIPFSENLGGYGIRGKKVLLLNRQGDLISSDFSGKLRKIILKNSGLLSALKKAKAPFKIQPFSEDAFLFLSPKGALFFNRFPQPLVAEGVLGFDLDKKNQRALFWTAGAIGALEPSKEGPVKKGQDAALQPKWFFKKGQNICNAFWVHDGSYVLFQDQNKIFLMELETFGEPMVHELLETREGTRAFYMEESGELFYLDRSSGNLMSLEIVPKWKVLEVPFSMIQEKEKEGRTMAL